jgi:hypothetical protein
VAAAAVVLQRLNNFRENRADALAANSTAAVTATSTGTSTTPA